MSNKIAALFVETDGIYFNREDVEPWDINKDARLYDGSYPVVAHPPCQRWGRYWYGGPMCHKMGKRKILGDDNGCFASALQSVRKWGGILEHPEASHAWRYFGLNRPPSTGGWIDADGIGFTCCVEQGHYGHRSRKKTWLYAVGVELPNLKWGSSQDGTKVRLDDGFHSTKERRLAWLNGNKPVEKLSKKERAATPAIFADLLINIAKTKY